MSINENNRIQTSKNQEQKAPWSAPQLKTLDADDTCSGKPSMAVPGYENFPYGDAS